MIGGSIFVSPDETTALIVPNAENATNRNVCLLDAKKLKVQGGFLWYRLLSFDQKEEDDDGLSWFDCILIQQETLANYRGMCYGSCGKIILVFIRKWVIFFNDAPVIILIW